jgi:hypothetical protein
VQVSGATTRVYLAYHPGRGDYAYSDGGAPVGPADGYEPQPDTGEQLWLAPPEHAASSAGAVEVELWWSAARQDMWTLASNASRQAAIAYGYERVRSFGVAIGPPVQVGSS